LDTVRWVGIYQPGYRISPTLAERYLRGDLLTGPDGEDLNLGETIHLNVLIFKGEYISSITQRLVALGGTILDITQTEWRAKIRVEIASKSILMIAAINGVSWIESAPVWQLNNQVAHTDGIMNVEKVWNIQHFYGSGQIGAISDTQLDTGNASTIVQDFKDCNGGAASRFTIIQLGTATSDTHGHGTHTAGSFLGNGYLVPSDVLFSIWFFTIASWLVRPVSSSDTASRSSCGTANASNAGCSQGPDSGPAGAGRGIRRA
jgi:hypothetical protein